MKDPNLTLLEAAVRLLQPLLDELVFAGGCATGLLITDSAAGGIRPTTDVDTITEVASYAEYVTLSERLRALGLTEDHSDDAPTCRWRYQGLIIDVIPTDDRILGFSNRWYAPAISSAQRMTIDNRTSGSSRRSIFFATKLEAFRGRGSGSHDLEDVVAVVDGRPELPDDVAAAPADVRTYIASEIQQLLGTRAFVDAYQVCSCQILPVRRDVRCCCSD